MIKQVPPAITALTDQLAQDATGATVTAEHTSGTRWRVTAEAPRVRVWMDYEVKSRGRLQLKTSKLFIDGTEVQRAAGYAHLMRIFADPDDGPRQVIGNAYGEAVEAAIEDAPPEVQEIYAKIIAARLAGLNPVLRRADRHWYICLENELVQLRVTFISYAINHERPLRYQGSTALLPGNPLSLVIDGVDLTNKVQGQLDRALGLVMAHQSAPARPGIARESDAAVNTSVQVRRQTVIRN